METLWFALLAWMLGVYVALDGMDFGVGVLHLWLAKTPEERGQVLRSIGPVWDGNEVWLVAAGGTLFGAFHGLYATAFSGFYLPLMMLLWFLIFRALAIELRHQLHDPLWEQFWDVAFALASILLVVFLGAAMGNIVRGVTYQTTETFFTPLWTHFGVGAPVGILDWYTLSVALVALVALAAHGALWLVYRTDGPVQQRARALSRVLSPAAGTGLLVVSLETTWVQPMFARNLLAYPLAAAFGLVGLLAFGLVPFLNGRGKAAWAFRISGLGLMLMTMAAGVAVYPDVLPAVGPVAGRPLHAMAADDETLGRMLLWWVPGMLIACGYSFTLYRRLPSVFHLRE